ncbi:LysR family transcriptional regulator [Desulfoluna butyratoxydans]|uniref:Transcription regulator hth lysr n=1 Tax=Desulfoluna butyratoxydans TaxID=231438 RepID=A0A4U8YPD9_9BACT|nr:LysR family transcriptional regulator [Desulfoluna butyratoxydans]VFQ45307.1 transcription regulator hth lysr [Desulfoluna butyratoxydans]
MELYQLRTFVTVAEEMHLTKASMRLFLSPPAVSAHIKALEEELSVRLFDRTPKGMELTEEGHHLKAQAEKVLSSANDFLNHAKLSGQELIGEFTLGYCSSGSLLRIPELVLEMASHHPNLMLNLEQCLSLKLVDALRKRDIDAGFYFGNDNPAEVELVKLKTMNLVIAAPEKWRQQIESAKLKDLTGYPWIWTSEECSFRKVADAAITIRRLNLSHAIVVNEEATSKGLIQAGVGLALMLEDEARDAEKAGQLVIWDKESLKIDLSLAWLKGRKSDPSIKALKALARNIWQSPPCGGGELTSLGSPIERPLVVPEKELVGAID